MTNYTDPYGRRPRSVNRTPNRSNSSRSLTTADYEQLARAYQELQSQHQELLARQQPLQSEVETAAVDLKKVRTELQIKDEVLQRQSADIKEMESELLWTRAALEQMQAKVAESEDETWQEKYARLQAEMENMRRRWDQRSEQRIMQAKHELLLDMLPLADHLDLAMEHAATLVDGPAKDFAASIEATRRAFVETLKRYGIERLWPAGELFDPTDQEAIGQIVDDQVAADHVAQVIQAGYREGDRVLRPARVLVSRGASQEARGQRSTEAPLSDVALADDETNSGGGGHGI